MAPISNTVVGIDDDQRFALMKFRRSVRDILKPDHNDHFLLRWLRARQWDPVAAEKMLRDSMIWREKWGIDTTLSTWQAPELLETHFPSGSPGFDKEGSPVVVVPFVGLDVWGLLHSVSKTDVLRMVIRHVENYLAIARKQAETKGPVALKLTVLFDLEGFSMRQYAWKPAAEMVFTLLKIYEANYPEILKTCILFNAPKIFSVAFTVVKKFMHEYTISKIKIYGTDQKKWQAHLLDLVDSKQLPKHFGGTMVDQNGDPRCSQVIKPGGKVPKSYYSKNIVQSEHTKEYKRVSIKNGEIHKVELQCKSKEGILKWDFGTESHDIKFSIMKQETSGSETVMHGPRVVDDTHADIGVLAVDGPATYTIVFDNKEDKNKKKVYYDFLISVPSVDLNLNDSPEAEEDTASATTAL